MPDSPTLGKYTLWPSDGEGHAKGLRIIPFLVGSMVNGMPIDMLKRLYSGRLQQKIGKSDWDVKQRRSVRPLYENSCRKGKRIRKEEGQVSLYKKSFSM